MLNFSFIPELPLTAPIDGMHQLFLGVAKDLLSFCYERMRNDKKAEIEKNFESIELPKEFARRV